MADSSYSAWIARCAPFKPSLAKDRGPRREKNSVQNARRARPPGSPSACGRNACPIRASAPRDPGNCASIAAFRFRARTGAAPSVPIATVTGSRSTIAGVMKSLFSRLSTILTGIPPRAGECGCPRILVRIFAGAVQKGRIFEVSTLEHASHVPKAHRNCAKTGFPDPDPDRTRQAVLRSFEAAATWPPRPTALRKRQPVPRTDAERWGNAARRPPVASCLQYRWMIRFFPYSAQ